MPRPPRCRTVHQMPPALRFGPYDIDPPGKVILAMEGLEALRLSDVEGLDHQAAAEMMGVSRQTFGRILATARSSVSTALSGGLILEVAGGSYRLAGGGGPGQRGSGRGRGGGRGMGRGGRGGGPGFGNNDNM